jgi:3-oxoacyl-[acyl-carrier-protein] synthase-3
MYLSSIASYLPEQALDNIKQARAFNKTPDFIADKIGAYSLPRKLADQDASDLATSAVTSLLEKTGLNKQEVELLCVVTQNPARMGIPHTSAIVHGNLDMPSNCSVFDLSLGCSGYVYGLSIVASFMRANDLKNGILITSDPYSDILDPVDSNTSLLFGDAATASLIQDYPSKISYQIGKLYAYANGKQGSCIQINESGKLEMNGRVVFNFALKQVPEQIKQCLSEEKIHIDLVDAILLHQGSYAIIDAVSRSFPGHEIKFSKKICETGNTVSSTIPLILESLMSEKDLVPKTIVASGFGVGLSIGTMLMRLSSD